MISYAFIKRVFDFSFAIVLVFPILAIISICAFLIKAEDHGSIFYLSGRLGKNGRIFKMFKLRTMKLNAPDFRNKDGSTFNSIDDPRLTRIGKFLRKSSLDELPQIFNILLGDMSFIGPRPDLPEHIKCYNSIEMKKLNVCPGISGYNQAFFRNSIEWKERLKNDVFYVENISLLLDLKIFYRTIKGIIKKDGIYANSTINNKEIIVSSGLNEKNN